MLKEDIQKFTDRLNHIQEHVGEHSRTPYYLRVLIDIILLKEEEALTKAESTAPTNNRRPKT